MECFGGATGDKLCHYVIEDIKELEYNKCLVNFQEIDGMQITTCLSVKLSFLSIRITKDWEI
jgi:competence transcription factor ComK